MKTKVLFIAVAFTLIQITNAQTVFYSNTFFSQIYAPSIQASIDTSISNMPVNLKTTQTTEQGRAKQLQWAFKVINNIPASEGAVKLIIKSGNYLFDNSISSYTNNGLLLTPPPITVNDIEKQLKPRLFITRSNVAIEGESNTKIYYNSDAPSSFHAKVILMTKLDLCNISISNLTFQGDGKLEFDASNNINKAYFKDECGPVSGTNVPGMIFIRENNLNVNISNCIITQINNIGLAINIGSKVAIYSTTFAGVIPQINSYPSQAQVVSMRGDDICECCNGRGMNYNGGIRFSDGYNSSSETVIANCIFNNLVEGIENKIAKFKITNNQFNFIFDHGIYFLFDSGQPCKGGEIGNNLFLYDYGAALKICGSLGGTQQTYVHDNTFQYSRMEDIILTGCYNKIYNNKFINATGNTTNYTKVRSNIDLDVYGGNTDRYSKCEFNWFENNYVGIEGSNTTTRYNCSIILFQGSDANCFKYGLSFNYFYGPNQVVYFPQNANTLYAPIAVCKNGSQLITSSFPDCTDKYSEVYLFKPNNINFKDVYTFRYNNKNYLIARFNNLNRFFLIGENPINNLIDPDTKNWEYNHKIDNSENAEIIDIADLNNDGNDEIYSILNGSTYIYGKESQTFFSGNDMRYSWNQWLFYNGTQDIKKHTITKINGNNYFISAFNGSVNLYKSGFRRQGDVHICNKDVIYQGNGTINAPYPFNIKIITSGNMLAGDDGDEIYMSFSNYNNILRMRSQSNVYTSGSVYNGSSNLNDMICADLYNTTEDENYNNFGTTIYCSTNGLGLGNYFYTGSYTSEKMISADLIGDSKKEIYTKFNGLPTIYYSGISNGIPKSNYGIAYNGMCNLRSIAVMKSCSPTTLKDFILSTYDCSPVLYKSNGQNLNGSDYMEDIFKKVFQAKYGPIFPNITACGNNQDPVDASMNIISVLNDKDNFNLYPNPVYNKLYIEFSEITGKSYLAIFNINGKELINQKIKENNIQIDLSNFPSGVYFIKVVNIDGLNVRKFIKN